MLHLIFVVGGNNYTFACLVWSSKSSNVSGELVFILWTYWTGQEDCGLCFCVFIAVA